MALQKTIYTADNTGVSSSYWKIRSIFIDYTQKTGSIIIDGYFTQDARVDGRVPVDTKTITITNYYLQFAPEVIDAPEMNEVKAAYLFLKGNVSEFFDAQDV